MKTKEKVSISSIVDPMLEAGKYTRADIMAEVRKLRPDFKDPSAAVSNGVRRLANKGKAGTLQDGPKESKPNPVAPKEPKVKAPRKAREPAKDGKASIPSIVDPMLLKGTYTRAEIMAEVRAKRPDFKDPSAAVSNGFRRVMAAGENPGLKEGERRRSTAGTKRGPSQTTIKDAIIKIDTWAQRTTDEVCTAFKRQAKEKAEFKKRKKARRIWP